MLRHGTWRIPMCHVPCAMRYALCAMRYALCAMRYALCAMRYTINVLTNMTTAISHGLSFWREYRLQR
jgi:hypothetical protein